jgi:hypothetical protein
VLYLSNHGINSRVFCDCFSVILMFARARYLAILTLNQVLWLFVVEFYRITYSPPSRFSQHLPALTMYDYIEHTHEMSRVNGATDALRIGPSAGYSLSLVFVHILLLFTAYVSSDTHMHIHVIAYNIVLFWIKLKLKIRISLTIQKPNIRHFLLVVLLLR